MIEPTDEMRRAFSAAHDAADPDDGFHFKEDAIIQLDAGLAAVLALVERDYVVRPAVHRVNERLRAEGPDSVATYGPDKPRGGIRVVPVCGSVSPSGRHVCDQERGHEGAHAGGTAAWA